MGQGETSSKLNKELVRVNGRRGSTKNSKRTTIYLEIKNIRSCGESLSGTSGKETEYEGR